MKKLGILVLLLAFSGVSCAVNQGGNAEVVVKTAKNNILGNSVPLFPGFKFVPERSFVYESGDVRMEGSCLSVRLRLRMWFFITKKFYRNKDGNPLQFRCLERRQF